MSLFDKKTPEELAKEVEETYKKQVEEEETIALCLSPGPHVIETADTAQLISKIETMLNPDYGVWGDGILANSLKESQGRLIIRWDVKAFRKYDAIGSMCKLSKLSSQKPIVIIEDITEIPDGDREIYDDPVYVENVLLHSWKNDTINLTHPRFGSFQLNRQDYTVLFPIKPGDFGKLHHRIFDGFAIISNDSSKLT